VSFTFCNMLMKSILRMIGFSLLGSCLAMSYINFNKSNDERYTSSTFKTSSGAIVHVQKVGNDYWTPIEGDFLIKGPNGKYILTSNFREWQLMQGALILAALVLLFYGQCSSRPKNAEQDAAKDADKSAPLS
jgi:hypothetical protein